MATERFGRRDRVGRRSRAGTGSGFLGDLIEVFQPSRRHVVAEQERRRDHVQLPQSGDPPWIDLDAGVAHLAPSRDTAPGTSRDDALGMPDAGRKAPPTTREPGRDENAPDVVR